MSKNPRKTITWVKPPQPTPRPAGILGPCLACRVGDHQKCCKTGCYNCPPVNHPRHHAAGNPSSVVPGPLLPAVRAKGRARNRVRPTPEVKR